MHRALTLDQSLAVLFALLTAVTNAFALTTQHIASTRQQEHSSNWRLALFLFRQPLWLLGWVALFGSLVFQALALHFGPMSEVQPLLVSELIIALLLRRLWLRQNIVPLAWISAGVTVVGLAVFLIASSPSGHANVPANSHWAAPVLASLVAAALLVGVAQRGSPSRRAAFFAAATGVMWALEATFIKATTDTIAASGFSGALQHWPLYALCVGGAVGLICEQAALHVGPLKISQPFIVIVDPVVSVVLGLWLYREKLESGFVHVGVASLAFVVMCFGVVLLTQSAPSSMKAELHRL
jgi:uncharacterized membrane protein